ncbi:XXYS1_4_G0033780.mRNA.1.CDS.1 [Saccharomyces cerevisiae]|nr:EM14S01-3B_G0031180.mRNA.1.CDS.1 [Saccharomyces cerevisiae]CAD6625210.1 XXYS1_4_G0033780.mRNA.1.CDS.1 [Saccharomyces cerevisiae]CAI4453040.1 AMH_1a_G0018190.mRNA.1.CDS.1 [Saccharomyces cerevisiae]CAI4461609.1 CEI_1a_G0018130.mRNA.1.CDS.1 [Saccharomyces cerevisiae]CAI6654386.1 AMH_1a_G0018190.mRNA.1.CDS.1 [Saccharomyces cerevisiae]
MNLSLNANSYFFRKPPMLTYMVRFLYCYPSPFPIAPAVTDLPECRGDLSLSLFITSFTSTKESNTVRQKPPKEHIPVNLCDRYHYIPKAPLYQCRMPCLYSI